MRGKKAAKIAVSAATYWVDKPFDYRVPEELEPLAVPGARVRVPFGRGNKMCEGIVLACGEDTLERRLKYVERVLDDAPILESSQIKLALWMRERFFCTVYDAVKAMLPAGLWFKTDGSRRVGDKTLEIASLAVPGDEALSAAEERRRRAKQQAYLLELLSGMGEAPSSELCRFAGVSRSSLKALEKEGLITLERKEVFRRPTAPPGDIAPLPDLNADQKQAFDGISALASRDAPAAALLFGVTGSGKTTVYIRLIAELLERGRSTILLVPEISLTPQMIETFSSHFGDEVAVLHSSLGTGERYDEWKRVKAGLARVVIGTRSAVFAPAAGLGAIIIDEEQEETYKSENTPRYNARDVAKWRCAESKALLLLGSATPDVCSRHSADTGKYSYFALGGRYNEMALPKVQIVDMKRELRRGNGGSISSVLRDELQKNLDAKEQSILFLNRRGAFRLITCSECGYTFSCPNCSVSLTWHSATKRLMCHYCGHSQRLPDECPSCLGKLNFTGSGTQKVVEELSELFPGTEILRMDADSVAPAGSHEALFGRFRNERIPIMVGTQMVTKGLNFENVTLVGVISADQSLYAGDYRSGERTFSIITQVVGRSGRGFRPGRAVIQTFTPENQIIKQAARQDYESFYSAEIKLRELQRTPPFTDLIAVNLSGSDEARVLKGASAVRKMLCSGMSGRDDARVLGPVPLPVVRVMGRYRYRVTLCCRADKAARALVSDIVIKCNTDKAFQGVSVFADSDPLE